MDVSLCKAQLKDAMLLHHLKVEAFTPLLEKYQDYDTSPANEVVDKIIAQLNQTFTDYLIIYDGEVAVGGVRIVKRENSFYGISPIFIVPQYQGKGIAQKVFTLLDQLYPDAKLWYLNTILQESRNCYLYEKVGYKKTGLTEEINDKMTMVFYEKYV